MPEIRGEVEAITSAEKGGWEKGFRIGDIWYRKGKGYRGAPPQQGQTYLVTYNESDYEGRTYYWATGLKLISNSAGPGEVSTRDQSIMKQVALKAAVEHCNKAMEMSQVGELGAWRGIDAVTLMAQSFFDWLMESEPPEPEEPQEEAPE